MSEQVAASKRMQFGVEMTAGTAVAAALAFHAADVTMSANPEVQSIQPKGSRFSKGSYVNREWTRLSLAGVPDFNELAYILESVFCKVDASGALAAKTRAIVPSKTSQDIHASFTFEMGDADRAWRAAYGVLSQLKLEMTRKECKISGGGYAKKIEDDITITADPAEIEQALILPSMWSVYLASEFSGLDSATAMDRVFSASFETPDVTSMIWTLKRSEASFAAVINKVLSSTLFRILVATDDAGMALLPTMRNSIGAKTNIRLEAVGQEISTGAPYRLTISSPVSVKMMSEFKDQDGVYAVEWGLECVDDGTNSLEIALVNKIATFGTPIGG